MSKNMAERIGGFLSTFYWYWFIPVILGQIALSLWDSPHSWRITHTNFNFVIFSLIMYHAGWILIDYKRKEEKEN
ncbi:hypothetical protein CK503_04095 [Aliifodinibius salipaludis]|uniref:Uncharacterized protein n=1 Tax=Fodinibius salipaludis TaxID=2032627 RepID=A0A2A2GEH0_9BACT|nr:hypothetical protein [Aliifodinibius salipaludis]PAU95384.1 hypothetical protein CK503_04095 [Aliifodinibius salipaludis]